MNDNALGETFSGARTVRLTATLCGLLLTSNELIMTVPEYAPGPSETGLILTDTAAGVAADGGVADSQFPPLLAAAATAMATDVLLVTEIGSPDGTVPPDT